jgi:hypothetical protein
MDGARFREAVEDETATELDRMGSSKALMWTTDGDLDPDEVLRAAARAEHLAAETFARWSDDEEDARATALFDEVASMERAHAERVDADPGDEGPDALHEHLRELDGTIERIAAGLVGRCLVTDATLAQTVSFHVGRAQRSVADTFRAIREENEELLERGLDELEHHCESEDDWERARDAAEETIRIAYDDYAETLEGMGVNPKPVC